jgi:lysophospholipase L1-like esterase
VTRHIVKLVGAMAATASMLIFGSVSAHAATITDTVSWLGQANFVALGDSFATGSGLGSYLDTTCYQSKYGYPVVLSTLSTAPTRDVTSYVCNGATSAGTGTSNSVAGQLVKFPTTMVAASVKYVTLTVGGNDLGFVSAMTKCVTGSTDCNLDKTVTGPIDAGLSTLPGRITANVAAISVKFPNAQILVTGYPKLFQNPSSTNQCKVGTVLGLFPLYMKASETKYLDDETVLLNSAISQGVALAQTQSLVSNVQFVDVAPKFDTHGLCLGSTKSWIQSYSSSNTVGAFHPTQTGQKSGYATAIAEKVTQQA